MTLTDNAPQGFFDHLEELRKRLVVCAVFFCVFLAVCWHFSPSLLDVLLLPLKIVGTEGRVIFTELAEGFLTQLKIAVVAAFTLTIPVILLQLWRFIAPALIDRERKIIGALFFLPPFLFTAGALFAYFFIVPLAWKFFLSFNDANAIIPLELETKLADYVNLSLSFLFSFGLAFQLPLILLSLVFLNLIKRKSLIRLRKYAILMIFIVAAILTPPDVFSQSMLALPLILLYEASIFFAVIIEKKP